MPEKPGRIAYKAIREAISGTAHESWFLDDHLNRLEAVIGLLPGDYEAKSKTGDEYSLWILHSPRTLGYDLAERTFNKEVSKLIPDIDSDPYHMTAAINSLRELVLWYNEQIWRGMLEGEGDTNVVSRLDFQAIVAGVELSSGRVFIHFLQPIVSLLTQMYWDAIDTGDIRGLLGFDYHFQEVGESTSKPGARIRVQGDLIYTYIPIDQGGSTFETLERAAYNSTLFDETPVILSVFRDAAKRHVKRAIEEQAGFSRITGGEEDFETTIANIIANGVAIGLMRAIEEIIHYLERTCRSPPGSLQLLFHVMGQRFQTLVIEDLIGEIRQRQQLAPLNRGIPNLAGIRFGHIPLLIAIRGQIMAQMALDFLNLAINESENFRRERERQRPSAPVIPPQEALIRAAGVSVRRSTRRDAYLLRVYPSILRRHLGSIRDLQDNEWYKNVNLVSGGPTAVDELLDYACSGCPASLRELYRTALLISCHDTLGSTLLCHDLVAGEARELVFINSHPVFVDYTLYYRMVLAELFRIFLTSEIFGANCQRIEILASRRNPLTDALILGRHSVTFDIRRIGGAPDTSEESEPLLTFASDYFSDSTWFSQSRRAVGQLLDGKIPLAASTLLGASTTKFTVKAILPPSHATTATISHPEHGRKRLEFKGSSVISFTLMPGVPYRVANSKLVVARGE